MTTETPAFIGDEQLANLVGALVVQHQIDLHGRCDSTTMLDQLHDAGVIARAADESARMHVKICRDRGASWSQIGAALGVTKQAAQQRYGQTTSKAQAQA